jgi:CHAT domain-containing protein
LEAALDILALHGGDQHPRSREILRRLGDVHLYLGDLPAAKSYYERELRINKRIYAGMTLRSFRSLGELALIEHHLGNDELAFDYLETRLAGTRTTLQNAFTYASEGQKLRYTNLYPPVDDLFLNFALDHQSDKVLTSSFEMVLSGKALIIEALAAERAMAACAVEPHLDNVLDQHSNVCGEIAALVLSSGRRPELYMARLQELYESKSQLETELSGLCADVTESVLAANIRVEDATTKLPRNAVLWEVVRYAHLDSGLSPSEGRWGQARYLVFTLDNLGQLNLVDLGEAKPIDDLVLECRLAIQSGANRVLLEGEEQREEARLSRVTRELYDLLIAPLQLSLTNKDRIYISPDGQLNLLPWEILTTSDDRYLTEQYQISYLSCARDLAKTTVPQIHAENVAVLFADPDYFDRPEQSHEVASVPGVGIDGRLATRGPPRQEDCLVDPFRLLAATRAEVSAIGDLLSVDPALDVRTQTGTNASESALKGLSQAPRILHLATHGYYCSESTRAKSMGDADNPLLYSGLALAGANRPIMGHAVSEGDQDGILTALEASGLNLIGNDLVVLSACQSGMGDVAKGEGIYGLRRAFQHAGAQSILMSMFDVPDQSTRQLMERFYANWLAGYSKAAALRQASLSILHERRQVHGTAHPMFWGGFVLVGDPN